MFNIFDWFKNNKYMKSQELRIFFVSLYYDML